MSSDEAKAMGPVQPRRSLFRPRRVVAALGVAVLVACIGVAVIWHKRRPAMLYKRAAIYLRSGNAAAAAESYRAALRLRPGFTEALVGTVTALAAAGDFDSAERELQQAARTGFSSARIAQLRVRLLRLRGDYELTSLGDQANAQLYDSIVEKDLEPAIKLALERVAGPDRSASAYVELGDVYTQKGKTLEAKRHALEESVRVAQSLEKKRDAALLQAQWLSVALVILETQRSSLDAFERAVELDPALPAARIAVAERMLSLNLPDLDRAREVLEPIIQREPGHRGARELLAAIERLAGNYDEALKHIRSITVSPQDEYGLLLAQVTILAEAGRWAEAREASRRLVELQPSEFTGRYYRGLSLLHEEDPAKRPAAVAEAVALLQNIFEEGGRWAHARFALAQGLLAQGKREQAVTAFKRVLDETADLSNYRTRTQLELLDMRDQASTALADLLQEQDAAVAAAYRTKAALDRADALSLRADDRLQAAGGRADAQLCDAVLAEQLGPAVSLVTQYADASERPALTYTALGDLYGQKARILTTKSRLLRRQPAELGQAQESGEDEAGAAPVAGALAPEIAAAQQSAMDSYRHSLELDPELVAPRLAVGRHLLSTYAPRPERARQVLEPVIQHEPYDRDARILLATAERLDRNWDKALEHLRAVQFEGYDDFGVLLLTAQVLCDARRWVDGEPVTLKLTALRPADRRGAYVRALVLLQQEDPQRRPEAIRQAVALLEEVFRQPGHWPQARLALAQGLLEEGRRPEAADAFKQALGDIAATVPGNVVQWRELQQVEYESSLALATELMGQSAEEMVLYGRRALEVRPDQQEAYEAVRRAQKAAGLSGRQVEEAVLLHARALANGGQVDEALGVCEGELKGMGQGQGQGVRLLRAVLLAGKGSYREAEEEYRQLWGEGQGGAGRELARMYVRLGRDGDARKVYEELVKREPQDVEAVGGLVSLLMRQRDVDGARKVLEEAEGRLGREKVRGYLMGLYASEGRWGEALELARGQVEAQPGDVGAKVMLADLQWRAGDEEGAQETYKKVLEADPQHVGGYRLGLLELAQGRAEEAVGVFRQGRTRHPGHLGMTVDLALALQAAGRPEEAMRVTEDALDQAGALASEAAVVAWYRAVMKAASGDAHAAAVLNDRLKSTEVGLWEDRHSLLAHMAALDEGPRRQAAAAANLALALSRAGADHAAVAQLRILEGVLPGERLPLCWQTNMLDLQGKHQEAVGRYEQLIREHPDWTYVRLLLALSHARHGESDSAIAVLQQALPDASPDLAGPICLNLGGLYQQQGLLDAALSCYQAAQEDPGAAPYACNNMAWIMAAHRGDLAAAQPLAERALELAPGFLDALDTLGWIHYLQGDAAKAVELLEKARAGLPSVPTVRYHLGMAYLKAGRRAEAKAELEEALAVSATFPEAGEAADALRAL